MWQALLAAASPDNLTLPGYGLCGIVISGLSIAVLKLYNDGKAKDAVILSLNKEQIDRERETANSTIPLLVKAVELLSATGPHIDRASSQDQEIVSTLHRVDGFLKEFDKRERRKGT